MTGLADGGLNQEYLGCRRKRHRLPQLRDLPPQSKIAMGWPGGWDWRTLNVASAFAKGLRHEFHSQAFTSFPMVSHEFTHFFKKLFGHGWAQLETKREI